MSVDALLGIIAGKDTTGFFEVRCRRPSDGKITAREWFPLGDCPFDTWAPCREFVTFNSAALDVYIGAAPRTRREGGKSAIERVWCLWADCDTPEALERLRAFEPQPSLIVRSGTGDNVHAWWALDRPLSPVWAERANRRLAFHLGGDMKATDAARILRPPGTLNHKHNPPGRVTVEHVHSRRTWVGAVVMRLPDPESQRPTRAPRPSVAADDPLTGISADRYYATLTGRDITHGNVQCPFHGDGNERNPSMRLYDTTYYCFGCDQGGSIYEFAGRLWGNLLPLRGDNFKAVRDRLLVEMGTV